jgi:hypothetical protein
MKIQNVCQEKIKELHMAMEHMSIVASSRSFCFANLLIAR